jgi:hypothetical protein
MEGAAKYSPCARSNRTLLKTKNKKMENGGARLVEFGDRMSSWREFSEDEVGNSNLSIAKWWEQQSMGLYVTWQIASLCICESGGCQVWWIWLIGRKRDLVGSVKCMP